MRLSSFGAFFGFFGFGLVFACSGGSGLHVTPITDAGPDTACGGDCVRGTHLDPHSCACVPDNPNCADPGICARGMHWDYVACACEPDSVCAATPCPPGSTWDPNACACINRDGGPGGCYIPDYGACAFGSHCLVPSPSGELDCTCDYRNGLSCTPYEWPDAQPPPPPPPDAGTDCWIPSYGYCPAYTSCITGYCPDNVTPISCYCEGNGLSQCTGACPPFADAGR